MKEYHYCDCDEGYEDKKYYHDYKDNYKCEKEYDHHDKKEDKKKEAKVSVFDFESYTLKPNVHEDDRQRIRRNVETKVASITFDQLKKGMVVWLNGVLGLDNDRSGERVVVLRIYKGKDPVLTPGNEIYRAFFEIDSPSDEDNVLEPFSHVDYVKENDKHVTYVVTLEADERGVFLTGPVTFTGLAIDK